MGDHILVHQRQKPFKCEICGKTFDSKRKVEGHIAAVHENKKFTCDIFPSNKKRVT